MEKLPPNESIYSFISSLNSREQSQFAKELAKLSPANFAQLASNGKWQLSPHLKLVNQLLLWIDSRAVDRLVITLAPRHGKSEFISKYFPAWTLGKNPDDSMILASYAETFATEWGGKVRDLLEEYGEKFFGVKLKDDRKAAGLWNIDKHAGGMFTAGVGGQITGRGARTFIIDDPFKNMEEANSETIRSKNMEWYRSAVYSRLTPDGAILIIATRWHEADITGTVLQEMTEGGDQWAYLHLPTLHQSNEVWADLTIPGYQAERIKAHEGMTFNQLDDFLTHCRLHAT